MYAIKGKHYSIKITIMNITNNDLLIYFCELELLKQ